MQVPTTNASHDYLFARLRGMWANAVKGEALQRLMNSGTTENLIRDLRSFGVDASSRSAFHKNLLLREMKLLASVRAQLDDATARFYSALINRVFYDEVKTILHYYFFPEAKINIDYLLVELPQLPTFPVEALLQAPNVEAFIRLLPEVDPEDDLEGIVRQLALDHDMMTAECRIDRINFRNLLRMARRTPLNIRREAELAVRRNIDIINVTMLLRDVYLYHFKPEKMAGYWIHDGELLKPEELTALVAADGDVKQTIQALPRVFRELLEPFAAAELYLCENVLWNYLHRYMHSLFRNYNRPALSIVAFPFLLRFETLNIGRVYEGVHFAIPPRDMHDMMIGV
ncbi:MAG: V-type ATPase subunit [Lentisphaeria bacterium]|jgi:vacuolar-type H+-ATPase subunit C/Vma6